MRARIIRWHFAKLAAAVAVLAGAGALAVNAAEMSLLNTFKWTRWGGKDQVVWQEKDGKRAVTLSCAPGEKAPSISIPEVDLAEFRDKEVELVLTFSGEDIVRGWCATNRWAGDQRKPGPADFSPAMYHWDVQFATHSDYTRPAYTDFPDGTFGAREHVIKFHYPATGHKFGLSLFFSGESGKITYHDVVLRESATKYMDRFVKVPEGFKCEYTDKVLKAPHLRGIVAGDRFKAEDYEKIRGWGCNLVRFWAQGDDLSKTDELLPVLDKLGLKVILTPAVPGKRTKDTSYALFNDEALYEKYLANWKKIAAHYKGDERIFAFDLMNEPFQALRKEPDDKYNFLAVQYEAAKAIRAIDPDRVLIANATGGSSPGNYNACDMRPLPMKDVIYQMHFYSPFFLTHAGIYTNKIDPDNDYPGAVKRGTTWTKKEVATVMDYMKDFESRYGAQIYVGEFSYMSKLKGAAQWLDDVCDLIESHGWKFWTFHSYGEFYGWNLESIRDKETKKLRNIKPGETTDRLEVMKKWWSKNWTE